ncbi:SA1002 family membrane protein [Streptococcus hongkongensis]|nr:hypothetical protein NC01_07445 [Streptococcus uberis]
MINYILLGIVIFSGFLSNFTREKRFYLLQATIMVTIETFLCSILFIIFISLIFYTALNHFLLSNLSSLFSLVLLVALINGLILYWINVFVIARFTIDVQVLTLCEYIIQWSLIYVTVYQVVFDNLITSVNFFNNKQLTIEKLDITNPADLILLVLPSLISVWVAIVLYKVKVNTL